jgi:acylphosphatase
MKHIKVTVRGRVQGVWFRASTRDEAVRLGICGFVRNEPDGDVYLEAEAEQESLNSLIDWLNHGPPLARVDGLDITEAEVKHLTGFTIQR